MKKIIVRLFAGIGIFTTFIFSIIFGLGMYFSSPEETGHKAPDSMVLHLDFSVPISEATESKGLDLGALLQGEDEVRLFTAIKALDKAGKDPRVKAVVARFGTEQPSMAHAQELRRALARFRESGKSTYAFGANYGDFSGGNRAVYLASAFEHIWVQPVGAVGLTGIGIQSFFGKTALESIGVTADFRRREEYKSVMENVSRDNYSAPVRANMEDLMKSLSMQIATGIGQSRKMDPLAVRQLMGQGPFTAEEASQAKIVTRIGYDDEMMQEVEDKVGKEATSVEANTYLSFAPVKKEEPKAQIAFINAQGMITDMKPTGPRSLTEEEIIDTDAVVQAFFDAAEDKDVKAILFRVNSPGGSPAASESIRRALIKAKESKKPVYVSMGDVAASGGYWISMNADRIFAEAGTVTGSIGVVVGKIVIGGLLQKIGIKSDEIRLDDNARLWSPLSTFSPQEQKRIDALLDSTYAAFTSNVAAARKIPVEKMGDLAKGRVFTGEQALKVGLVDELGGLDVTLAALKKEIKLNPDDPVLVKLFPEPETTLSMLMKLAQNTSFQFAMVGRMAGLMQTPQIKQSLGPVWSDLRASMINTSPVNASMPSDYARLVR